MLTGDKLETAICIAKSSGEWDYDLWSLDSLSSIISGLFAKSDNVHVFGQVNNRTEAHNELNALRRSGFINMGFAFCIPMLITENAKHKHIQEIGRRSGDVWLGAQRLSPVLWGGFKFHSQGVTSMVRSRHSDG